MPSAPPPRSVTRGPDLVKRGHDKGYASVDGASQTEFRGHWGASSSDVWGVATEARILRYGTSVLNVDSTVTTPLYAVWGAASTNVWVVGGGGTILHFAP